MQKSQRFPTVLDRLKTFGVFRPVKTELMNIAVMGYPKVIYQNLMSFPQKGGNL